MITADFKPKPAYVAYNMLATVFKGGRFLERLPAATNTFALRFQSASNDELLALWNEGREQLLVLPGLPAGTVKIDLFGNETPLELKDGVALLKLSRTPFTLRIPGGSRKRFSFDTVIPSRHLPELLFVGDKMSTLTIPIVNTTGKMLTGTLIVQVPEFVAAERASHRITLRPGERTSVVFRLKASENFRATPENPARLLLGFALGDSNPESIAFELCRENMVKEAQFRLFRENQYFTLIPNAPGNDHLYWRGPEDLSAKISLSRTRDGLLLKAEVNDDRHWQPFTGRDVWKGDSLQLGLQFPDQSGSWKIGLTHLADGKPEVFIWRHSAIRGTPEKIRLVTQRDEAKKLTLYEAEIPFSAIGLTAESAKRGFRFNLIINDNDGEQRKGFLMVAPGLGYQTDDETKWPVVNLE